MDESKLHPSLRAALNVSHARALATGQSEILPIIVGYQSSVRSPGRRPAWAVQRIYSLIPAAAGRATREQVERLSERPEVAIIWLDEPVYAFLDVSVPKIGVPAVWETGNRGTGIKIAIIDTGIDGEHPDFTGRIAATADFTKDGVGDGNGHGTHVAGIAAGSGAASKGKYTGVAPEAVILAAKVLNSSGQGMMSGVMAGIEWAVEQGAQVINLSLGSPGPCDGSDAISAASNAAVEAGAVVCAAAGNEGPGEKTVGSPGCATRVITIGASDDDDQIANFSSRGPTLDKRVKPDVLFPGVHIVAPRATGTSMGKPVDDFYTSASGTSMATPHAAGTVALMLYAQPELAPDQVKSILARAAIDLELDRNTQGAGRVDAARAVELAREAEPTPTPGPGRPPSTPSPTPPPPTPTPEPSPTPVPPGAPGCMAKAMELLVTLTSNGRKR